MSAGNGKKLSSTSSGGVIQLRAPTTTGGSVEVVEGKLGDGGGHRVQDRATIAGVGGEQDLAGLANRFQDFGVVEGDDGAGIDDFDGDAVLRLPGFWRRRGRGRGWHRRSGW